MPFFHRQALDRRSLLALAAASLSGSLVGQIRAYAAESADDLELSELDLPPLTGIAKRCLLVRPKHLGINERVPLVVLLHGLGETYDERAGSRAWVERYGLSSSYARLQSGIVSPNSTRTNWTAERLSRVNSKLAAAPFRGLAMVCPFTPNVAKTRAPDSTLARYATWIADAVIPSARAEAPVFADAKHTFIDGCSLGGYVAIETFIRRPEAFGAFGVVQPAVGIHRAPLYGEQIAGAIGRLGPRAIHLETSTGDPFREATLAIAASLSRHNVPHTIDVLPGPHDQPWLRDIGTLEMLRFYDRLPR